MRPVTGRSKAVSSSVTGSNAPCRKGKRRAVRGAARGGSQGGSRRAARRGLRRPATAAQRHRAGVVGRSTVAGRAWGDVFFRLLAPGGVLSYFEYMYMRPLRRMVSNADGRKRLTTRY